MIVDVTRQIALLALVWRGGVAMAVAELGWIKMSTGRHAVIVGSDGLLVDVVLEANVGFDSICPDSTGNLDSSSMDTQSQGDELEVGLHSVYFILFFC